MYFKLLYIYTHSTFTGNSGVSSILNVGYAQMNFTGKNIFIGNNGTSLKVSEMFQQYGKDNYICPPLLAT